MTTIRAAALAAIVALAGAACTTTRAATPVDRPALEVPPPPPIPLGAFPVVCVGKITQPRMATYVAAAVRINPVRMI